MKKIPIFRLPDQPDLERALNLIGAAVNFTSNKKFEGSYPIVVDDDPDNAVISFEGDLAEAITALAPCKILTAVQSKPDYIFGNAPEVTGDARNYWIYTGLVNNLEPSNFATAFPVTATTFFFLKITLSQGMSNTPMDVLGVEIVVGATQSAFVNTPWSEGITRPEFYYVLLSKVTVQEDKTHVLVNYGCGSIQLSEHITYMRRGAGTSTIYTKQLTHVRLNA